jgi:hypothetical protein
MLLAGKQTYPTLILLELHRSSDEQQGLNSASSQPSSSHGGASNDLLEEDKYERFISDCNSPHTLPLFPAHSMPPLGPIVQPTASLHRTYQQHRRSPQPNKLVSNLIKRSFFPPTLTKGGTAAQTTIGL